MFFKVWETVVMGKHTDISILRCLQVTITYMILIILKNIDNVNSRQS